MQGVGREMGMEMTVVELGGAEGTDAEARAVLPAWGTEVEKAGPS